MCPLLISGFLTGAIRPVGAACLGVMVFGISYAAESRPEAGASAFLVHNSTVSEQAAPTKKLFEIDSSDEMACDMVLLGRHIIARGSEDVFGLREYADDLRALDSAVFTKVTIVAPKIPIGRPLQLADPGVRVVITSAAPGWVHKCLGYEAQSAGGSVTIRRSQSGALSAELRIEAKMTPVVESPARSYSLRIDKTIPVQTLELSDLTPWQGAAASDWTKLAHP